MEESKDISLKEKIDTIFNSINEEAPKEKIKIKQIKLPRKARVKKRKLKKGWIGIIKVDENRNISAEKAKVSDSTIKTKDGLYHAMEGEEILFWNGKFPVIIQPSWTVNPLNIRKDKPTNETYGQPYIQAKMLKDIIKPKKGGVSWIIWIILIGGAVFLISKLFK
jgi:hypothetical protein